MKNVIYEIKENIPLTSSVYQMRCKGDTSAFIRSGQFLNIKISGLYLRRPISLCDKNDDEITILYKVVGEGTKRLSEMKVGEKLDVLSGLGNGYDTEKCVKEALLIGGGVGVPPLYLLAKDLLKQNKIVHVVLGFNTKDEVFYEEEFRKLGCDVKVVTVDGSYGEKGFVSDHLDLPYDHFYTCGPEAMLKAVYKATKTSGQFSFEERMGCGFGACMGCTCQTLTGNKRICKDGPVLEKGEILWK